MRKLALLMLAVVLMAHAHTVADLSNRGFEDESTWSGPVSTLTINTDSVNQWWYSDTWFRQDRSGYAAEGSWCAGDIDGFGTFGGLVQFIPVIDEQMIQLSISYLLWRGDWGDTSMSYAVYAWHDGDIISLSSTGPGVGDILLGGTRDVTNTPYYIGDGSPGDDYETLTQSVSTSLSGYDYIGVWIQCSLMGGSFYVDDVNMNLTPVPEPATMGLLGLGGLLILMQKRR